VSTQPKRKRPVRKKPVDTEQQDREMKFLVSAINGYFGYVDGRCEPRKLWETEDGPTRYRVNWWNWEREKIIKSAFCHIRDVNPDRPDKPGKDYEPQYEIQEIVT